MANFLNLIFENGRRLFKGEDFNAIVDAINKLATSQTPNSYRKVTVSGSVTMLSNDGIVEISQAAPAAVTVNLPVSPTIGLVQTVKDGAGIAGNFATRITLIPPGSITIDGQAHIQMNSNWEWVSYYWNGTNFRIVG